jgi:UDP-N-acetylglucosamine 1-carboxyvinyltransferase
MDLFRIDGGRPLAGSVRVEGAKNAALPICVAALLTDETLVLHRVPQLRDVSTILYTLGSLGKRVVRNGASVAISSSGALASEAHAYSVQKMRASFLVLGPLVARLGRARVPLPGGCAIGARPVDLHLRGLEALGAHVVESEGLVDVQADGLRGARIELAFPSVGATEHLLMTGTLARGVTEIVNAALEPEVLDLVALLRQMGASIEVGDRILRVEGSHLDGAEHWLIPDRMEAGTLLLAGLITDGEVAVEGVQPNHLAPLLAVLDRMGADVEERGTETVLCSGGGRLRGVEVETAPHPGFPTDLHPPLAALMCRAAGASRIRETVFERRFTYVDGLRRMGAQVSVEGRDALIRGPSAFVGGSVDAPDIRAGAALVLAGLSAQGRTLVGGLDQIDRGYERLAQKLASLGAAIERRNH